MTSLLAFIFIIGLLVFAHELGHFLVAKRCGVRVEQFSLGFGPSLFSITFGETQYKICLLPFGGYVKMSGESGEPVVFVEKISGEAETPFEKGDKIISINGAPLREGLSWRRAVSFGGASDAAEFEVEVERPSGNLILKAKNEDLKNLDAYFESEYPRAFSAKSVARRMSIVGAGPLMNFALPFVLLPLAFMAGVYLPSYTESPPLVVRPPVSDGSEAALQKGDRIVAIDGRAVQKWADVSSILRRSARSLSVEVERGGERFFIRATRENLLPELIASAQRPVIGAVAAGSPASVAGLKKGDEITAIGGEKIRDWSHMASIIKSSPGQSLELSVVRDGKAVKKSAVPRAAPGSENAVIGITMQTERIFRRSGFFKSVADGVRRAASMTVEVVSLFFGLLFSLIGGEMSLGQAGKTLGGPLFIAKMSGAAAEQGFSTLLFFASFISVNLAVVNLLPIPILDGGHIVYLTIEAVRRKPLERKTLETAQRIGFSFLIAIMLIATYNDVSNLWGDISGWFDNRPNAEP